MRLEGHSGGVSHMKFSNDGTKLYTGARMVGQKYFLKYIMNETLVITFDDFYFSLIYDGYVAFTNTQITYLITYYNYNFY